MAGLITLLVVPVLWVHPSTTSAMAAVAAASAATGALAVGMLRLRAAGAAPAHPTRFAREVSVTSLSLRAVLVLASIDLLMARHRLPPVDSDLYALGSVGARAVFWLLQFAGVAAYAELASHGSAARRRSTLLSGLGVVLVLGAVGTAVAAVLPEQVVTTLLRPEYAGLVRFLPLFAALGTALAAVQYLVMAGIARGRGRGGVVIAAAVVAEAAMLLLLPDPGVGAFVTVAVMITAVTAVVLLVSDLRLVEADRTPQGVGLPGHGGGL